MNCLHLLSNCPDLTLINYCSWVNAISGIVCIVAFLPGIFIEHQSPDETAVTNGANKDKDEKKNQELECSDEKMKELSDNKSPSHDFVPVSVAIYVFFAFFCAFVMMET